jgi:hypothetical protein
MYNKIKVANKNVADGNNNLYENIAVNAQEKEGKWVGHDRTAKQIKKESDVFYDEISNIKDKITVKQKLKDPNLEKFSEMDKGEALDVIWFKEGSKKASQVFLEMIQEYKMHVIQVFGSQYPEYIEMVEARFFTGDMNFNVKNKDNNDQPWLDSNFKGFPLISSLAKLTLMQNDIRQTETTF